MKMKRTLKKKKTKRKKPKSEIPMSLRDAVSGLPSN